jgi:hypothetical protein
MPNRQTPNTVEIKKMKQDQGLNVAVHAHPSGFALLYKEEGDGIYPEVGTFIPALSDREIVEALIDGTLPNFVAVRLCVSREEILHAGQNGSLKALLQRFVRLPFMRTHKTTRHRVAVLHRVGQGLLRAG